MISLMLKRHWSLRTFQLRLNSTFFYFCSVLHFFFLNSKLLLMNSFTVTDLFTFSDSVLSVKTDDMFFNSLIINVFRISDAYRKIDSVLFFKSLNTLFWVLSFHCIDSSLCFTAADFFVTFSITIITDDNFNSFYFCFSLILADWLSVIL